MTLLAAVCLAPAIPLAGSEQAVEVVWDGKQATVVGPATPNTQAVERLRAAACRIAPDREPPQPKK